MDATVPTPKDWRRIRDEAKRIGSGTQPLYGAVRRGELKAVRLNDRGDLRTLSAWVDEWLLGRLAR